MADAGAWGMSGILWLFLGLTGLAGLLSAWATVLLLVYPVRERGVPGLVPVQGFVTARAESTAGFVETYLLPALPPPRRLFEQLGPDRFRREFSRTLKAHLDNHVDDVMSRRNGRVWDNLSVYARNRVYAHVHRRLPFVVDDFVEHVQRELDDIVDMRAMVRRFFEERPDVVARLFIESFGPDLRLVLPLATGSAMLAGLVPLLLLGTGHGGLALGSGVAALSAALVVLAVLSRPSVRGGVWPFHTQGILHRRRGRFLQGLARRVANDALSWQALVGEFLHGAHAPRVRHIMRREVSGILDVSVFRATLQFMLGPEGFAEAKASAVEKALEVLSSSPLNPALREHYRVEVERTLEHAVRSVPDQAYVSYWDHVLSQAWRRLPVQLGVAGLALGWLVFWLVPGMG